MKYGFIGCGNMGGALAKALSKKTNDILLSDYFPEKAKALAETLGCAWTDSNLAVAADCSYIFLAVKPQMMEDMLRGIASVLEEKKPVIISMAAGLSVAKLEAFIGCLLPVIRIMPNTSVAVDKGVISYCCNDQVTLEKLDTFLGDIGHAAELIAVDESRMDAATAVGGCAPAYGYMFIEALADGAVTCGVPRAEALRMAAAALAGAAEMVLCTGRHPGELKDAVCSPGGSTIAGLRVLEQRGFRGAAMDAIIAAFERNKELGK